MSVVPLSVIMYDPRRLQLANASFETEQVCKMVRGQPAVYTSQRQAGSCPRDDHQPISSLLHYLQIPLTEPAIHRCT